MGESRMSSKGLVLLLLGLILNLIHSKIFLIEVEEPYVNKFRSKLQRTAVEDGKNVFNMQSDRQTGKGNYFGGDGHGKGSDYEYVDPDIDEAASAADIEALDDFIKRT